MNLGRCYILVGDGSSVFQQLSSHFSFMQVAVKIFTLADFMLDVLDQQTPILVFSAANTQRFQALINQLNIQNIQPILINDEPVVIHGNVKMQLTLPLTYSKFNRLLKSADLNQTTILSMKSLIGDSPFIITLKQLIPYIAASDSHVLLVGETGTGKNTVANLIHQLSSRRYKPCIRVDCQDLPEDFFEEKLAAAENPINFSNTEDFLGPMSFTTQGSLILNNVEQLPLNHQQKLVSLLKKQQFAINTLAAHHDLRLIACTTQHLEEWVAKGLVMQELFAYFNIAPISFTPLRNRSQDIPLLLTYFQREIGRRLQRNIEFSTEALTILTQYLWPGNIEELINFVEEQLIKYPNQRLSANNINTKYLEHQKIFPESDLAFGSAEPYNLKSYLEKTEINLINEALNKHEGNVSQAARFLSLGRTTLIEKIRRYGIRNINTFKGNNQPRDYIEINTGLK